MAAPAQRAHRRVPSCALTDRPGAWGSYVITPRQLRAPMTQEIAPPSSLRREKMASAVRHLGSGSSRVLRCRIQPDPGFGRPLRLPYTAPRGRHRTRASWEATVLVLGRVWAWIVGNACRFECKHNSQPRRSPALPGCLGGGERQVQYLCSTLKGSRRLLHGFADVPLGWRT